jgi:hypothetical protein
MTHKAQHIIVYHGLDSLLFLTYIAKTDPFQISKC